MPYNRSCFDINHLPRKSCNHRVQGDERKCIQAQGSDRWLQREDGAALHSATARGAIGVADTAALPGRYVARPQAGQTRQFREGKNYRVDIFAAYLTYLSTTSCR